jgi:hypothetical protein
LALGKTGIVEEGMHRDLVVRFDIVVYFHHTVKKWAPRALALHSHSNIRRKQ